MNRRGFFAALAGACAGLLGRRPTWDYAAEQLAEQLAARCRPIFHRVASHILQRPQFVYTFPRPGHPNLIVAVLDGDVKAVFEYDELIGLSHCELTNLAYDRFLFEFRVAYS